LERLDHFQLERRLMLRLFIDHLSALAFMLIVDEFTLPYA
jgi:hypothetical protein